MNESCPDFVDFYEIMEINPKATTETIESVFRYLARKYHPDVAGKENHERFKQIVVAFKILRNPETRATFDLRREARRRENAVIIQGAGAAIEDCSERADLLSVFYAQRRTDMKEPGVSFSRLSELTTCPKEVLEFHLWYFRQKGWIEREECGLFSITAEGVDQIESRVNEIKPDLPRIEHRPKSRNHSKKESQTSQ